MSNKKKAQQYSDDFNKWQKNQYLPGVYTGDNFPPDLKHGGKRFGYAVLIQGIIILLFGILMVFETDYIKAAVGMIVFGLVVLFAGWNKIMHRKNKK